MKGRIRNVVAAALVVAVGSLRTEAFMHIHRTHHHRHPRVHARPEANDDAAPLLSRRELLVPSLLALGSGALLLRNNVVDGLAYDSTHKDLFARLEGSKRILEVGVGKAVNVNYYPSGTEVTGIDPYPKTDALSVAQAKAKQRGVTLTTLEAAAEALPFPNESFDAVVSTLVFCSVQDPRLALQEVARVLRPGGRFVFIEHVWAPEGEHPFLHAQQEWLDPLQAVLAQGCHLNRHTDELFLSQAQEGGKGGGKKLFSRIETIKYLDLDTQWPISVQVAGVLVK